MHHDTSQYITNHAPQRITSQYYMTTITTIHHNASQCIAHYITLHYNTSQTLHHITLQSILHNHNTSQTIHHNISIYHKQYIPIHHNTTSSQCIRRSNRRTEGQNDGKADGCTYPVVVVQANEFREASSIQKAFLTLVRVCHGPNALAESV
jgi:hypothetical protein